MSDAGLGEARAAPDPIAQFRAWLDDATAAGGPEPQAMTLATVAADGAPHARVVYLRGLDERGFAFFTNYESSKGRDLEAVPRAALVFFWALLHRQVRVEGTVARLSAAESDAYFAQRPRGRGLSAWASHPEHRHPLARVPRGAHGGRGCALRSRRSPRAAVLGRLPGDAAARRGVLAEAARTARTTASRTCAAAEGWRIERLSP